MLLRPALLRQRLRQRPDPREVACQLYGRKPRSLGRYLVRPPLFTRSQGAVLPFQQSRSTIANLVGANNGRSTRCAVRALQGTVLLKKWLD